jgi:hypothetical protein
MKTISILLRISDNVLDEDDWPIWCAIYNHEGFLFRIHLIKEGVYAAFATVETPFHEIPPLQVGSTLRDLKIWVDYDSTGHHPEEYHDFRIFGLMDWKEISQGNLDTLILLTEAELQQRLKKQSTEGEDNE